MKALLIILFVALFLGCSKQELPKVVNAPENPELLSGRLLQLSQKIPFIDYSTLPEPVGHAESGVDDLVLLGSSLRSKFSKIKNHFNRSINVEIIEKQTCSYVECRERYKLERRINRIVYTKPTHMVKYISGGKLMLTVKFRFSPYYSKFHILGFESPAKIANKTNPVDAKKQRN